MNLHGEKRFSPELFANPRSEFYPSFSWIWNGEITREGIREQMAQFRAAGIRSVYILPEPKEFRPGLMETEMAPDYLTPAFFDRVRDAAEVAEELGMCFWLYDEGGWPSGGACGVVEKHHPDPLQKRLTLREAALAAETAYAPAEDTLAAYVGEKRIEAGYTSAEGVTVSEYFLKAVRQGGNLVNLLDRSVTDTFIKVTYDAYADAVGKDFGKFIPLMFTDEPHIIPDMWTRDLEARFVADHGYSTLDYLPIIARKKQPATDAERAALADYAETVGDLFRENYLLPLREWCAKHGIAFGGHVNGENIPSCAARNGYNTHLTALTAMHIPGVDAIWRQIFPAENPVSEGTVFFPRVASSAAAYNGTELALSETFAIYGDGLTADEMRYILYFQFLRGINVFNFMAFSYAQENAHLLCARPSFSFHKPNTDKMSSFIARLARTQVVMQTGSRVCDTLLYLPAKDFARGGEISEAAEKSFTAQGETLEEKGIEFDIADDFTLCNARPEGDALRVGARLYRHIVMPECRFAPDFVRALAEKYAGTGEPLCELSDSRLRVTARRDADGKTVYFIFNQSTETVTSTAKIPSALPLYRLNPANGKITKAQNPAAFTLPSGEAMILLASAEELPADETAERAQAALSAPEKVAQTRYEIVLDNAHIERKEEDISLPVDADFCGTVAWRFKYSFPEKPAQGCCRLTVDVPRLYVAVAVDGQTVGTIGEAPQELDIPAEKFGQSGEILLTVANTMAAENVRNNPALVERYIKIIQKDYNAKATRFEADAPAQSVPQNAELRWFA